MPQAFGRYRLLAPLDTTDEVQSFRGALPGLEGYERPVVVRMLSHDARRDAEAVDRFFTRARAAEAVQHPNAVPIFEIGQAVDGTPFMVEGWVPGPSLAALVRGVRRAGLGLPPWFCLHVASEVVAVLDHAVAAGVYHGRIDAARVRLSYDGEIRLNGFGQRVPIDDVAAVRLLLLQEMDLAPTTFRTIQLWLDGRESMGLERLHHLLVEARSALKTRVTLLDMASALTSIEADALGWADEVEPTPEPRTDPVDSSAGSSAGSASELGAGDAPAPATDPMSPPDGSHSHASSVSDSRLPSTDPIAGSRLQAASVPESRVRSLTPPNAGSRSEASSGDGARLLPFVDPRSRPLPSITPVGLPSVPSTDPEGSPSTDPEGSPSMDLEGSPSMDPEGSPSTDLEGSPSTDLEGSPSMEHRGPPSTDPVGSPTESVVSPLADASSPASDPIISSSAIRAMPAPRNPPVAGAVSTSADAAPRTDPVDALHLESWHEVESEAVTVQMHADAIPIPMPSSIVTSMPSPGAMTFDPTGFGDREPTDPSRPPVDLMPTLEIHPGRRGDVQLWLEVPPTIVGPRRLDEGLRLIRELGSVRKGLSLSVDGLRFSPLPRVARQLGDALPALGSLDPGAPVQGVLADTTALQVIGGRARARATGRLTFVRHEPDFPERITLDLIDGRLVSAMASSAPLSAWARLLRDAELPEGMAARAFAVVVSEELAITDVGGPLLLTALTQARAQEAEAHLDAVLGWSWARYAFTPGPPLPTSERVTDVSLMPRLYSFVHGKESPTALRARLSPVLTRPLERADDFDVVLSRLKLPSALLSFAARLGHGDAPRDALSKANAAEEPQALAVTYVLVQLGALIPA